VVRAQGNRGHIHTIGEKAWDSSANVSIGEPCRGVIVAQDRTGESSSITLEAKSVAIRIPLGKGEKRPPVSVVGRGASETKTILWKEQAVKGGQGERGTLALTPVPEKG